MPAAASQTDRASKGGADRVAGFALRVCLTVMGGGLTLAAFGIWLVPGSGDLPMLSLMKFGVSLFMLIAGMCCVVMGRDPAR